MVLVDTSVWVDHLRKGNAQLSDSLSNGHVLCHHFVIGELACGHIRNRAEILSLLQALPAAEQATHDEVLQFIEANSLMGKGLGYIDIHLLASAALTDAPLWTLDKQLGKVASELNAQFAP